MNKPPIQPIDLRKNTVFILGAGASKPYGFPLGTELKQTMIANLSNQQCQEALLAFKMNQSLINEFTEALPRTYYPTIDIFLEKKIKFRRLGAYLIAYSLLPLENDAFLFPQRDWYGHLYNVIDFEHNEPNVDNIVFVSLNYDRSLERFLHKNILYNCPDNLIQLAESKLQRLKIIHAHGSLGSYPLIPYGVRQNDVISAAAESIRIASDRLEDSNDFRDAQNAIANASNIVFLGFGYDPTTLKLLWHDADISEKRILGTIFRLDISRISDLTDFFNGKIETLTNDINADWFVKTFLPH